MAIGTAHRNDYIGNGATATYDYSFKIFAATDLYIVTRATGAAVDTELTYLTHFTVTGVGSPSGGTITLLAGNLASGTVLTIRRKRPLSQTTDLKNQSRFFPQVHEDSFDHSVMLAQQIQDQVNRSIYLPDSVSGVDLKLPTPVAGQALAFNNSASGFTTIPTSGITLANFTSKIRIADVFSGATFDAQVSAAAADLPAGGGTVDCCGLEGAQTVSSPISIGAKKVFLQLGASTITCSASMFSVSTGSLFIEGLGPTTVIAAHASFTGAPLVELDGSSSSVQRWGIRRLRIVMTAAGAEDALKLDSISRPSLEDVSIEYSTGTGVGIDVVTCGALEARHVSIIEPGIGVRIDGDVQLEHHWSHVEIVSAATFGFEVDRTVATDIGAIYLHEVRVTNPGNRSNNRSFLFSSSEPITIMPIFMTNCVGDNARGGVTLEITNIVEIFVVNSWFTNGASAVSEYAAIKLTDVVECFISQCLMQGLSRGIELAGTITSTRVIGCKISGDPGGYDIYLDSTPTLNGVTFTDNVYVNSNFCNDFDTLLTAGPVILSPSGGDIYVAAAGASASCLRLINKSTGGTNPIKHLRVGATGDFEIVDNDFVDLLFSVSDVGAVTLRGRLQLRGFATFADLDATPSVAGGNLFHVDNSLATNITALDNGVNGQIVTLVFDNNNTTVVDGGLLNINGNFNGNTAQTITLVFDGAAWYEMCRSAN